MRVSYANLSTAKQPDFQTNVIKLPFQDSAFDVIIYPELLEHVSLLSLVLPEVYRMLRPGGCLLVCVPFFLRTHGDPHEFGRGTDYYWIMTLVKLGFQIITISSSRNGLNMICLALSKEAKSHAQAHNQDYSNNSFWASVERLWTSGSSEPVNVAKEHTYHYG